MLSRCIGVDAEVFAAEYWGRKPLLSPAHALPRDFCDLLCPDTVDELIAERGVRAPFIRLAKEGQVLDKDSYLGPAGFGAEIADQVDAAKVLSQLGSGATVVLQGLHRLWPPLIDFVAQAVADIGHPVQANAYITPPDNRGFDFHYDVHDVFVLQVSGRKRWIVHEPVHRHPLPTQPWTDHRDRIAERVTGDPVLDIVLCQGDSLYLPRGWVHAAQAMDTASIHLTIGVSATTALDVARAVVDELGRFDEFRASLPIGIDPADPNEMSATAAKVIAEVVGRLRDNGATLSTAAAERLIARHDTRTRPEAVRPLAMLRAADQADTVRVRRRRGLLATIHRGVDGRVSMQLTDKTITFPAQCAAALEEILTGGVTHAGDLPGLDAADGAVLLRRLLREGVVVPT
ncbi:cupin domain-containing protein [Mycobacterium sp. ZZG]